MKKPFVYVDEPLTYYRLHEEATSSIWINDGRREKEDRYMFSKIWSQPIADFIMLFYKKAYNNYS